MFADEVVVKIGVGLMVLGVALGVLVMPALYAVAVVGFGLFLIAEAV